MTKTYFITTRKKSSNQDMWLSIQSVHRIQAFCNSHNFFGFFCIFWLLFCSKYDKNLFFFLPELSRGSASFSTIATGVSWSPSTLSIAIFVEWLRIIWSFQERSSIKGFANFSLNCRKKIRRWLVFFYHIIFIVNYVRSKSTISKTWKKIERQK